jgi:hypothetical protein
MKNPFDLSDDELRAEVAFLMGWQFLADTKALPHVAWCLWTPPNRPHWTLCPPPRYTESLDACIEFEKSIAKEEFNQYLVALDNLVIDNDEYYRHNASPVDRCRAFLLLKQYQEETKNS